MDHRSLAAVVLVLVFLVSPIPVAADASEVAITETSYSGTGVLESDGDRVQLWQSEPHELNVTISDENASTRVRVCAGIESESNESVRTLDCQVTSTAADGRTVSMSVEESPANVTGDQSVVVTVWDNPSGFEESSVLDRRTVPVQMLEKDGDLDSDRLTNYQEVMVETNMTRADTDGDGLRDGEEVHEYGTSPTDVDTDGDGLRDGDEISRGTDPTSTDTDGDDLNDSEEVNEYETNPTDVDTDGDGIRDGDEISRSTDPTSADTDGDGLSDSEEIREYNTDPTDPDTDGDGLADGEEVNSHGTDPRNPDTDGDFVSDGTEVALWAAPNSAVTPLAYLIIVFGGAVAVAQQVDDLDRAERLGQLRSVVAFETDGDSETDSADMLRSGSTGEEEPPADAGRDPAGPAEVDETAARPLITDEARVLRMLDEHDGRLPQNDIVERTEWSKSKVSRLLSRMEDDDQIKKITIGRENLVTHLSDQPLGSDPDAPDD